MGVGKCVEIPFLLIDLDERGHVNEGYLGIIQVMIVEELGTLLKGGSTRLALGSSEVKIETTFRARCSNTKGLKEFILVPLCFK